MQAAFITPNDPRWSESLERLDHDVYHRPEYLQFSGEVEGGCPEAFYFEEGNRCGLIPLIVRRLPDHLNQPADWLDATSPYGYASPLTDVEDPASFITAFLAAARERGLVTCFLRFHPLLPGTDQAFAAAGRVIDQGPTIVIDLARKPEDIWQSIRTNHKRHLRRLERDGFRAVMDDWQFFVPFIDLYRRTMTRVGADAYYLFDDHYFHALRAHLGQRLHLCTVLTEAGEVAAAGLFTRTGSIVQYHLSGTAAAFRDLAPSKLMLDTVRRWAAAGGARWFHLGGGRGSVEDSLYQFKKGFSNLECRFHTGRLVIDPARFAACVSSLRQETGLDQAGSFFPPYRARRAESEGA